MGYRYRTKPFEIGAVQFTGNYKEITDVFHDIRLATDDDQTMSVWDYLQHEWIPVNIGDFIIRGMKGEYYPCDSEVFAAKYEAIVEKKVAHKGDNVTIYTDGSIEFNGLSNV